MKFIADLHIHSRYSRATAKNLDLEHLYIDAQKKGISVLGTGDSTHPEWFSELKEKLIPDESGLLRLRPEIEAACNPLVPESCRRDIRFILESEISSIYKKNGKTRKNHNLVYFPDFDSAEKFNVKLDAIGNIKSDGRPILGLDAKILLEILLETHSGAFMIPAHIWTPWFSLFGSRSGFDTLDECFEDLSYEIFAAETGLSSDPPMNWRISELDRLTLVSNSDAHSPAKLGREANLFNTDMSYGAIYDALKTGNPEKFLGTIEFFPEEGKYHNDGHKKCKISMTPELSLECGGICPECGKPLTLGVNYRVNELADRDEGFKPENSHPFDSIVPLDEILSEITGTGIKSKRVGRSLATAVERLGSEFDILRNISIDEIKTAKIPLLGEAVQRVRSKKLNIIPGYDGEFGKIQIFSEDEKEELMGQKLLFCFNEKKPLAEKKPEEKNFRLPKKRKKSTLLKKTPEKTGVLNDQQKEAVLHTGSPLIIIAGPGTGKTHTITQKAAYLISEKGVSPESILAITFTRKAADEMRERILKLSEPGSKSPYTATIHSLCHSLLTEAAGSESGTAQPRGIADEKKKKEILEKAINPHIGKGFTISLKKISALIEKAKQQLLHSKEDLDSFITDPRLKFSFFKIFSDYNRFLEEAGLYDFEDLIFHCVKRLEMDSSFIESCRKRFSHIFVDEYQDLNLAQYTFIRILAKGNSNICVIGDPDQSIYGFRGSDPSFFNSFPNDFPGAKTISLARNYRSAETILKASGQVISPEKPRQQRKRLWSGIEGQKQISFLTASTEKSEAAAIGMIIEKMIGGTDFYFFDSGGIDTHTERVLGFSDFAVLTRTAKLAETMAGAFERGGIPFQYLSRDSIYSKRSVSDLFSSLKRLNGLSLSPAELLRTDELTKELFSDPEAAFDFFRKKRTSVNIQDQLLYLQQTIPEIKREITGCKKEEEAFYHILKLSSLFDSELDEFFKTIALESDADLYDINSERVKIMTIHASKGLEFPVVFIPGCENGLIPFIRNEKEPPDMDEERRLLYVAMTRAQDYLFLSRADKRVIFGRGRPVNPSPFLSDIDGKLLKKEPAFLNIEKPKKPVQMMLF